MRGVDRKKRFYIARDVGSNYAWIIDDSIRSKMSWWEHIKDSERGIVTGGMIDKMRLLCANMNAQKEKVLTLEQIKEAIRGRRAKG